jgi:hypothetical protein
VPEPPVLVPAVLDLVDDDDEDDELPQALSAATAVRTASPRPTKIPGLYT